MRNPIQSLQRLNQYVFREQTARRHQMAPSGLCKGPGAAAATQNICEASAAHAGDCLTPSTWPFEIEPRRAFHALLEGTQSPFPGELGPHLSTQNQASSPDPVRERSSSPHPLHPPEASVPSFPPRSEPSPLHTVSAGAEGGGLRRQVVRTKNPAGGSYSTLTWGDDTAKAGFWLFQKNQERWKMRPI